MATLSTGGALQDVRHRVNAPSRSAEVPRYSFVEKLVFLPRASLKGGPCIARPSWGSPTAFGSAARLQRLAHAAQVAASRADKRKREEQEGTAGGLLTTSTD